MQVLLIEPLRLFMKRHPQNFCSGPFPALLPLPLSSRIDRIVHSTTQAGVDFFFFLAALKHIAVNRLRINV
jgi:hypothetical protein